MASKLLIFVLMFSLTGCLNKFKPDYSDARLPRYTEEGNNVAGAYVDGLAWAIDDDCPRTSPNGRDCSRNYVSYVSQDSHQVILKWIGGRLWYDEAGQQSTHFKITFTSDSLRADSLALLLEWEGKTLGLDQPGNGVKISYNDFPVGSFNQTRGCSGTGGNLFIRKALPVYGTQGKLAQVIVSGTFAFTLSSGCRFSEVTHGRFDFAFAQENLK